VLKKYFDPSMVFAEQPMQVKPYKLQKILKPGFPLFHFTGKIKNLIRPIYRELILLFLIFRM